MKPHFSDEGGPDEDGYVLSLAIDPFEGKLVFLTGRTTEETESGRRLGIYKAKPEQAIEIAERILKIARGMNEDLEKVDQKVDQAGEADPLSS